MILRPRLCEGESLSPDVVPCVIATSAPKKLPFYITGYYPVGGRFVFDAFNQMDPEYLQLRFRKT